MSTQTIRPNAIVTESSGVTQTGAANTYTAISDSSDSSYVLLSNNPFLGAQGTYDLGTYTLTAGQTVKRYRVGVRFKTGSGNARMSAAVIKDGSEVGTITQAVPTGSFATLTGPWVNGALTQSQIDGLRLYIYNSGGRWDSSVLHVAEAYVEIEVTSGPTATVTGPTGTQTQPNPTVTWTYSDADGDAESRFQVKIFNSATYGGGGFNADTSTPTYWSGYQSGPITSHTLTAALPDDTYKAYVLVEDGTSWSPWASGSAFTVATTPPVAPAAPVATLSNANARIGVALQSYLNALNTEDADLVTTLGDWATNGNCTVTRSTTVADNGPASLRLSSTASGDMGALIINVLGGSCEVTVGQTVRVDARVRAGASARSASIGIAFLDIAFGLIGSITYGSDVTDATGSWVSVTHQATAPANAVWATVVVRIKATGAGSELHYFDKITMTPTSTSVTWGRGGLLPNAVFRLQRSNDAGVTWTDIYTTIDVPEDGTQALTYNDYAAPNSLATIYRVRVETTDPAGTPFTTAWSSNSNSVTPDYTSDTGWLLKDLTSGTFIELPLINPPFKHKVTEQQARYNPLGRSRVVVVSDTIQGEEFQLDMEFLTVAHFNNFKTLRNYQRTLLLQRVYTDEQWYIRLGADMNVDEPNTAQILVSMNAVEVDAP